jgi:LPXTG-motif cell wall-anchored protein
MILKGVVIRMKKIKMLIVIPMCCMLMMTPVSAIKAGAVTVDIKDNYNAGLLQEESDSKNVDYTMEGSAADAASSTSSSSASSSASSSSAASKSSSAASSASNTASSAASSAASTGTTVTPVSTTQTTDLPKTGDDDRILITFIGMLASFSIFLTALVAGKGFGKNA